MKAVAFASATAMLGLPVGASAQTMVPKQVQLGDLGVCLVRQAPAQSDRLLATLPDTADERAAATMLVRGHDGCIRGRVVSGRTGAIRGAVAQAMLDREPALLDALATRTPQPVTRPEQSNGRAFVIAYAGCLLARNPEASATLLRTPVASEAERAAFVRYGDALKDCMPEGQQYTVNIADVRNHVAASAYQAVAPRGMK